MLKNMQKLIYIYRNRKDFSRANKLMSDVEDIKATYEDYAFDNYNYIRYNNINNKFDDKYDAKPVKILQKIHINEEDFLKRD